MLVVDETMGLDANADGSEPGAVGIYALPDADLVRKLRSWLRDAVAHKQPILKRREKDQGVYSGDQWDEGDKQRAEALKKPMLTLNLMLSIIGAITGEERENRQDIKYFGNDLNDETGAQVLNNLLKWVMTGCGGEFRLSEGFQAAAIEGESWFGVDVDFYEDPAGRIVLECPEDKEMFPDPADVSRTLTDARYLFRIRMWAEDEIEAKWPGKLAELQESNFGVEPGEEVDASTLRDIYDGAKGRSLKLFDKETRRWAICEAHWWQIEPGVVVVGDDGELEELSKAEFEERKAARAAEQQAAMAARVAAAAQPTIDPMTGAPVPLPEVPPPLDAIERPLKCFYSAFFSVNTLLEKSKYPFPRLKRFRYVPLRALLRKKEREYFGYIRPAIDPQMQHNVEQSVMVQLQQLMPKGSWMAPKGAYHNKQDWETKLAQPGSLLEYNGQRGKPEPIPQPPIPRHLYEGAAQRPDQIRSIVGVNHELTGDRAGSNTGVVIDKRSRAARTVLTVLFDGFRETKIELGKVLLAYMQHYIRPGRTLRVVGQDAKPEGVVMTAAAQFQRFDVTVDESDNNVNERFEALHVLQTTLPQMAKAGMSIVPEFVDLLPLPVALRDRWKRQIGWDMAIANRLPPPNWEIGMPVPLPGLAPGLPAPMPGGEPGASPPV